MSPFDWQDGHGQLATDGVIPFLIQMLINDAGIGARHARDLLVRRHDLLLQKHRFKLEMKSDTQPK